MLRFVGYLLRLHLASDWSRNNKHSTDFSGVHGFTGKTVKRAWLLDADWLSTSALRSLGFPLRGNCEKGFQKRIASWFALHCFWTKRGYFILKWQKMDMQQSAVFWWTSKVKLLTWGSPFSSNAGLHRGPVSLKDGIFLSKNVLMRSQEKVWVGTACVADA